MRQRGKPQRSSYDQERPSDISVFIGGLPNDTTYQDVRELCQKFGKTSRVFLQFNKVTNEFSGNAFARFKSRFDAQNFMKQTHLTQFRGSILNVNIATNPASQQQDEPPPPPPPPPPPIHSHDSRPYYPAYSAYPPDPYDYVDPGAYLRDPPDPSLYYHGPESRSPRPYDERSSYNSSRKLPPDSRSSGYTERDPRYSRDHNYRDAYENDSGYREIPREQRGYGAYDMPAYPGYYPDDRIKPRADDYNYNYEKNDPRDPQQPAPPPPPPPPPPPSAGARDYAYADPYAYSYNPRSIR